MNNYLLIKRLIFELLLIAVIYFLFLITNSFIDKPVIKDINITNLDEINISQSINQPNKNIVATSNNNEIKFEYKLIGIRAGDNDSSVIVKKANKEYLVRLGESLDNNFELIQVLPNTAVFRNGQKMYRIDKEEAR
jgi:hypothetical protein